MTVTIVGEHNPYGADPRYALYPAPERSAGGRLCKVLGLSRPDYIARFRRRNLLTGDRDGFRWSAPKAREAAAEILLELEAGDALVLLGARVCAAFYASFIPCEATVVVGRDRQGARCAFRALTVPHPSGRSRLWNERGMVQRARVAILDMLAVHGRETKEHHP